MPRLSKLCFHFLFLFCSFALGQTTRFDLRDAVHRNTLVFVSDAPLQKVVGISHYVSGWVELDPDNLSSKISGQWEMDLRALDTGDPAKTEVLQETILHTGQFPIATATLDKISFKSRKLSDGKSATGKASVTLKWREITQSISVPITLTYFHESSQTQTRLPGNLLKVSAELPLDVTQFQIAFPESESLLYSKTVKLLFDAIGSDKLPTGVLSLPSGPKPKG